MIQVVQILELVRPSIGLRRRTVRLLFAKLSAVRFHETVALLSLVVAGRVVLVLQAISVSVRRRGTHIRIA